MLTVLLSVVVAVIFAILALRWNGGSTGPGWLTVRRLDQVANVTILLIIVVFLVWFRRARIDAEGRGWHQRRGRGWAIGGWIVPIVNLWFPFQVMGDIWRAGAPPETRARTAWLPVLWWISWLLCGMGVTSASPPRDNAAGAPAPHLAAGTLPVSMMFLAISGLALIAIVRKVSNGPVGTPVSMPQRHPAMV